MPLPRARLKHRVRLSGLALAALAVAAAGPAAPAHAQGASSSPFQPALSDPRHAQGFRVTDQSPLATANAMTLPSGTGATGFASTRTGPKKPPAGTKPPPKPKPGARRPPPAPPPPPPGPPQFSGGHTTAPQTRSRAAYADAYRPPDAAPRRPRPQEVDAYAPLGVRVGSFLVNPAVEISRGFDTNPTRSANGRSSGYTLIEPTLKLQSQWSRHEYGVDLRGSYSAYDKAAVSDRPLLDVKTHGRFDISRDSAINTESRFFLSTDYPGSPNLPADIARLPVYTSYGTSPGFTQRFNRLELTGKVGFDRTQYQDSKLTDGTTSSNRDRNYDQLSGQLRASYELRPGVRPFVEIAADRRSHDQALDRNGYARNSRALTPRIGTTFDIAQRLSGEISVGYTTRRYEDPALRELSGIVFDAALIYAPTGLTTLTLTGSSRADESVVAGWSGALRRDVGLQVDHALRRWLVWTVRAGAGFDDYIGGTRSDTRMSLGTMLTYKLNRDVALKGEYRYDRLSSSTPGVDYDASLFLLGLKFQR